MDALIHKKVIVEMISRGMNCWIEYVGELVWHFQGNQFYIKDFTNIFARGQKRCKENS